MLAALCAAQTPANSTSGATQSSRSPLPVVGLGFVETWGLSQGNHNIAGPLGVAHAIVGVAAPLLIISSGIVYNKPQ